MSELSGKDAIQRLRAVEIRVEERAEALQRAIELQAREYERRLELLNGEAERLAKMQATYLPREVFDRFERDMRRDILAITIALIGAVGTIVTAFIVR